MSDYGDLGKSDAITLAEPHVECAFALNPLLAEAHAAAGRLIYTRDSYTAEELSRYEKAVELNPNYTEAWVWLAHYYRFSSVPQHDKAFTASRNAAQLDPLSAGALANYIIALVLRNKLAEADIELAKLASIDPDAHANLLGYRMSKGGNWASAAQGNLNFRLFDRQSRAHRAQFAIALAHIGLDKEAMAVFDSPRFGIYLRLGRVQDALELAEGEPDYALGLATFLEGDREKGIELIGKAMDFGYVIPRNRADLQPLYDDPGFKPILAAQEAKQRSEHSRFLTIVCNDNPYQSFWQPEQGTCEKFLAESGN